MGSQAPCAPKAGVDNKHDCKQDFPVHREPPVLTKRRFYTGEKPNALDRGLTPGLYCAGVWIARHVSGRSAPLIRINVRRPGLQYGFGGRARAGVRKTAPLVSREGSVTHAFISYVRENSEIVDRLASELKSRGIEVWLDRESIYPGVRWKDAIHKAIQEGAYFIACFSNEFNKKQESYMRGEISLALDRLRQMPRERAWFIPVVLDEATIPYIPISDYDKLSDIETVSLSKDWNSGIEKILHAMKLDDPVYRQVVHLIDLIRYHPTERLHAVKQLVEMAGTVPALIEALRNSDEDVYQRVAEAIETYKKKITDVLWQYAPHSDFFVAPDIPGDKEKNARQALDIPRDEQVLGLIDCTFLGSAKDSLVFGTKGIYFRGVFGSEKGVCAYADAKNHFFKNSPDDEDEIVFPHGVQFSPLGSNVSTERVIRILNHVVSEVNDDDDD